MSQHNDQITQPTMHENCSPTDDTEKTAQSLGKMFAALAHPARSRIVLELGRGELCVNDLSEMLKISHSSVSQHLAILRSQALIKEQKAGRFVFYRLINPEIAGWLTVGECFTDPVNHLSNDYQSNQGSGRSGSNSNNGHESRNAELNAF